jgi:hypothetical protein
MAEEQQKPQSGWIKREIRPSDMITWAILKDAGCHK